jgi:hypothetical protein
MTVWCPNCDATMAKRGAITREGARQPCRCRNRRPLYRVRDYAAVALAHRHASGELARVRRKSPR